MTILCSLSLQKKASVIYIDFLYKKNFQNDNSIFMIQPLLNLTQFYASFFRNHLRTGSSYHFKVA